MNYQYLAGFFDGEGSIFITKTKPAPPKNEYHRLRASISQKNREILDEIKEFIGHGVVFSSQEKSRKSKMYILKIEEDQALAFLENLLPYLKLKQLRAKYAIQFRRYKKTETLLSEKELRWREMHRQLISLYNDRSVANRKKAGCKI